jgi:hypothetical protein
MDLDDALRASIGLPEAPDRSPYPFRAPYAVASYPLVSELPVATDFDSQFTWWALKQLTLASGETPPPPSSSQSIKLLWLVNMLKKREAVGALVKPPSLTGAVAAAAAASAAGAWAGAAAFGPQGSAGGAAAGAALGIGAQLAGTRFSTGEFGSCVLFFSSVAALIFLAWGVSPSHSTLLSLLVASLLFSVRSSFNAAFIYSEY